VAEKSSAFSQPAAHPIQRAASMLRDLFEARPS
jgi:hypothetical protein